MFFVSSATDVFCGLFFPTESSARMGALLKSQSQGSFVAGSVLHPFWFAGQTWISLAFIYVECWVVDGFSGLLLVFYLDLAMFSCVLHCK